MASTSSQVILTRVRVPQPRKDLLRRPRLLDVLHRNLHRKLTFISAPAGYGKTALLLDFASDLETAVCWYSISPDHTDLVTFVQHLVASLQQQFPNFGKRLSLLSESTAPDPYSVAIAISNEMVSQVTDFCLIVLDDFHLIGEVQTIVSFIETLLDHLPEQVRFVAASRSIYGVPTVPLYVHEELQTLGVKDLRFRAEELQALVRQNYHLTLPAAQAAQLAQVADGWIIALLLAVRALSSGEIPQLEGRKDQLYGFLADDVLAQQPAHIQDFLLATSIFEDFTEPLCREVLQVDNAAALLQELLERNLFLVPVETAEGLAYRYHQLFAEFLRDRLSVQAPQRLHQLQERAAAWFAQREDWERTVQHLLLAGDREEAALRMNEVTMPLYVRGRFHLLETWKNSLSQPPEVIDRAPKLALYWAKALIDTSGSVTEVERLLDIAERKLRQQKEIDQTANVLLTRSVLRQRQGRFDEALSLAQMTQNLLDDPHSLRWLQAEHRQGAALFFKGDVEGSLAYLLRAAEGFRALKADYDLVIVLTSLVVTQLERGDIFEAQNCALETVQILRRIGGGSQLANSLNAAGYVVYQTGRYKEAWRFYQESLAIAQSNHSNTVLAHVLSSQGDLLRDLDEWALAEDAYRASSSLAEENQIIDALPETYFGLSELERLRGNFNEALHWLREATRYRNETTQSPLYQLGVAAIYLDMGQPSLARTALESALESWQGLARPKPEQVRAEFLLAQAHYVEGQSALALEWLSKTLHHAAILGYDQFLVIAGRRASDLLSHAQAAWPAQAQLRSLVQRVQQFQTGLPSLQDAPPAAETRPATRLELLAFGAGAVRRNGELLPNTLWRSMRARALFFFIGEQGHATKDEIALNFWPDFSPEKVNSNFHATLWRIRQAVGQDSLVFDDEVYSLSPKVTLWSDVADFEAFARRGADRGQTSEDRAESWRRALALYSGPYLSGVDLAWAEERRRHLETTYQTGLTYLAHWELERQHFEAAQTFFATLSNLDPYSDEAQIGLLECSIGTGAVNVARANYLAFEKRLAAELGTQPSPDLQKLYRRITPA